MASQQEIREKITNQIIDALKSGGIPPWRRPWGTQAGAGFPVNFETKRRYSGVNPLLLQMAAQRHGFKSKYWATFKQWKNLGGTIQRRPHHVPPGEWGCSVVLFKPVVKTEVNRNTGDEEEVTYSFLRTYTLFNLDQVEGAHLDPYRVRGTPVDHFVDFEPAERAIQATGADIRYGGDRAFYRMPSPGADGDFLQLPHKHQFSSQKEYYATAFHELAHWTERRLNWQASYAESELRAEIGACYALAELGVPQSDDLSNHTAYVQHWLEALRNNTLFIFKVSTAASKAVDFLLSFSRPQPAEEPELIVAGWAKPRSGGFPRRSAFPGRGA
jgi:antirestriction protein ArdC